MRATTADESCASATCARMELAQAPEVARRLEAAAGRRHAGRWPRQHSGTSALVGDRAGGGPGQPRQPQLRDQPSPADQRRAPGTLPARHRAGADLRQRRWPRCCDSLESGSRVRRQPQHPRPALPVQQAGAERGGVDASFDRPATCSRRHGVEAVRAEDAGCAFYNTPRSPAGRCAWVLALFGMGGSIDRLEEDRRWRSLPTLAPALAPGPLPVRHVTHARCYRGPAPCISMIDPDSGAEHRRRFRLRPTSVLRTPQVQRTILQPAARRCAWPRPEAPRASAAGEPGARCSPVPSERSLELRVFDGVGGEAPTSFIRAMRRPGFPGRHCRAWRRPPGAGADGQAPDPAAEATAAGGRPRRRQQGAGARWR